jgi:ApaG protein
MEHQVTEGISVAVETAFQPTQSNPLNMEFLYTYTITIQNLTPYPVKLLSRHWHIIDSIGTHREVQGDGVIGRQPVIEPNNTYQYSSAAGLRSELGKMFGTYTIENLFNKKKFSVVIPEFQLIVPAKLN